MSETTQWEYRVRTIGNIFGTKDEELEAVLNEWGLEGWKATQVYISQSKKVTIVARRPLSAATRRRSAWPGQ